MVLLHMLRAHAAAYRAIKQMPGQHTVPHPLMSLAVCLVVMMHQRTLDILYTASFVNI